MHVAGWPIVSHKHIAHASYNFFKNLVHMCIKSKPIEKNRGEPSQLLIQDKVTTHMHAVDKSLNLGTDRYNTIRFPFDIMCTDIYLETVLN